jgi:hypothetical protein
MNKTMIKFKRTGMGTFVNPNRLIGGKHSSIGKSIFTMHIADIDILNPIFFISFEITNAFY